MHVVSNDGLELNIKPIESFRIFCICKSFIIDTVSVQWRKDRIVGGAYEIRAAAQLIIALVTAGYSTMRPF